MIIVNQMHVNPISNKFCITATKPWMCAIVLWTIIYKSCANTTTTPEILNWGMPTRIQLQYYKQRALALQIVHIILKQFMQLFHLVGSGQENLLLLLLHSSRFSKPKACISVVKHCMVNTHKHISQNPAILQHPTQEQQPQIPPLVNMWNACKEPSRYIAFDFGQKMVPICNKKCRYVWTSWIYQHWRTSRNLEFLDWSPKRERERECYQSGPAGGGISNPVNPLMHWACEPWPICRIYWRRRHMHKLNTLQYMTILFLVISSSKTIFHKLCMDACSKPSSIWTIN